MKTIEWNCVDLMIIYNEIERAKEWPGKIGDKACPHRMAVGPVAVALVAFATLISEYE